MNRNSFARIGALATLALLQGCAALQASRNSDIDSRILSGDFKGAAELSETRLGFAANPDGSLPQVNFVRANVLDHLDAGGAWGLAGDPDRAIAHLDAVEEALKDVEGQNLAAKGAKQLGAAMLNDSLLDYVPSPAEAILVNYYKSLAFLRKGEPGNARVELNRADDRTRRAVDHYAKEIEAAQAAAAGKDGSYSDPSVKSGVDSKFPEMSQWAPYKEFVVPPVTYLHALFLSRSNGPGDRQRGAELFNRVRGLIEENETVEQDAKEAARGGTCPTNDCVWVLAEQGLGPELEERRLDVIVPTFQGPITVAFALPALKSRIESDPVPVKVVAGEARFNPQPLGSMDRVVQTEFQRRFPGIVTRALVSATVKAVAQKQINDNAGQYGALFSLAGNLMASMTSAADVRSWRTLPGQFSVARLRKTPGLTQITVETVGGSVPVELPRRGSQIVHVRAVSSSSAPVVEVLNI